MLGQRSFAPAPAGALPASAAPSGCEQLLGDVWEWTSSEFDGYDGFTAHPYREYSEVFFRTGHRVLRGGAWATAARVATPTFRNWDLPQRRQIFAGLRLAADA
jgi:iron(II)-dependent oxidoreductase